MGHFRSDLRDLEFDPVRGVPGSGRARDHGRRHRSDTLRVLRELDALATGPLAEGFAEADRPPADVRPAAHAVTVPTTP